MNRRLQLTRWFFSTLLTIAFGLSQFACLSISQEYIAQSNEQGLDNHIGCAFTASSDLKQNVFQFLADNVEDDLNELDEVVEKSVFFESHPFRWTRNSLVPVLTLSKLHDHPFLESKPFRTLPIFLEIQVFQI